MRRWLLRRSLQAAGTLVLAAVAAFVLMRLAPGDPLAHLSEDKPVPPEAVAQLRARYGLDQPIGRQFAAFAAGLARGDLGVSIEYGRPVGQLVRERLGATVLLGGTVLLLNFTLGLWLGVRQALARGRPLDRGLGVAGALSVALPSFWVALMLIWLLGLHGPRLPVAGLRDPLLQGAGTGAVVLDMLRHLILPAATLTLVTIGATMRYQRAAMLEALVQPFVRTATARGLAPPAVTRHAWRTALVPVITLLGLWLPILVTGAVFVEAVFAWPGLGQLAAQAAGRRDYPLMMGCTLLAGAMVVLGSLLADVAAAIADPRTRPAA